MMPSFKGRMRLDDDEAVWTFEDGAISGARSQQDSGAAIREMIPYAMPSFKDRLRGGDDEAVSTFEAGAVTGATASQTGARPKGTVPEEDVLASE